jgi:hypothetical protein
MNNQIKEKDESIEPLRQKMFGEIEGKEELIQKETETYIAKMEQCKGEEEQLSKIHKEYKDRYTEFEKTMKTT